MGEFLAGLPACTVTAREVFVSMADESQCAAVLEFVIKDGPTFHAVDTFKFNEPGQIIEMRGYFHPQVALGMSEKTDDYVQSEKVAKAYCEAASVKHTDGAESQVALFADDGCFTMEDPVGTPLKKTKQELKDFLSGLPACTVTAKEIIVGQKDELQCAVVMEFKLEDGPSFGCIDSFKLA